MKRIIYLILINLFFGFQLVLLGIQIVRDNYSWWYFIFGIVLIVWINTHIHISDKLKKQKVKQMAGISEAEDLIKSGKDCGTVLEKGAYMDGDTKGDFLLIKIHKTGEIITQFDYKSDLQFDKNIIKGDRVELHLLDKHTAIWKKKSLRNKMKEEGIELLD